MDAQRAAALRMTALLRQLRDPETGEERLNAPSSASPPLSSTSTSTVLFLTLPSSCSLHLCIHLPSVDTHVNENKTNRSSHRGRRSLRGAGGAGGAARCRRRPGDAHARRLADGQALRDSHPRRGGHPRDGSEANQGRWRRRGAQDLRPWVSGRAVEGLPAKRRALFEREAMEMMTVNKGIGFSFFAALAPFLPATAVSCPCFDSVFDRVSSFFLLPDDRARCVLDLTGMSSQKSALASWKFDFQHLHFVWRLAANKKRRRRP